MRSYRKKALMRRQASVWAAVLPSRFDGRPETMRPYLAALVGIGCILAVMLFVVIG